MRVYLVVWLVGLALWVYCLIDAIAAREDSVRNLPKLAWIFIVLLFPFVGSIAWLAAGRPVTERRRAQPWERSQPEFPEYDRPGRAAASDPEKDAEFLRQLRARAEEQRRAYREQKDREQQAGEQAPDDTPDPAAG